MPRIKMTAISSIRVKPVARFIETSTLTKKYEPEQAKTGTYPKQASCQTQTNNPRIPLLNDLRQIRADACRPPGPDQASEPASTFAFHTILTNAENQVVQQTFSRRF